LYRRGFSVAKVEAEKMYQWAVAGKEKALGAEYTFRSAYSLEPF
jgi:hypothetical protein